MAKKRKKVAPKVACQTSIPPEADQQIEKLQEKWGLSYSSTVCEVILLGLQKLKKAR